MNIYIHIKICLSIISGLIIYIITNLSKQSSYNGNNKFINFFYHEPGTVCPFGILLGKFTIILTIIQIYYLYAGEYDMVKKILIKAYYY